MRDCSACFLRVLELCRTYNRINLSSLLPFLQYTANTTQIRAAPATTQLLSFTCIYWHSNICMLGKLLFFSLFKSVSLCLAFQTLLLQSASTWSLLSEPFSFSTVNSDFFFRSLQLPCLFLRRAYCRVLLCTYCFLLLPFLLWKHCSSSRVLQIISWPFSRSGFCCPHSQNNLEIPHTDLTLHR